MEALLEPWWAVFPFRTLLVRQWERDLEIRQRFLGLQLVLGPATVNAADTWRRYCEAVELLLLASSVHPRAFREMALERCMSAGGYEWGSFELEECIPVRLFVLINYSRVSQTYPTWHLDALSILLTPPADHSDAYKTPLSQLSKMTGGKIASRQIPVVHSLSALDARVNEPTIRVLDCISQLHQKRIQEELHYSSCLHRFGIEWVDLTIITGTVHPTSGLIESIEAFKATPGLRINHVVFPKLRFDSHDLHSVSRGLLCRWVSAFSGLRNDFTASRMDLLRPVDFQPVGSKHVEFREPSNTSLTAFCSSIMHSGDVEHVSLSRCGTASTCSEPSFLWCWLFYALFNATARHSVKHLTIEAASFPLEDMMSVCELIVSSRPLEMLTDPAYEEKQTRPASSANRPAQVVLRNGAQIHLELSQCPTAASI